MDIIKFELTDDLLSVDETLNEQTEEFIKQCNIFTQRMDGVKAFKSLVNFLTFLNDYSKNHFIYQESIMELKSYPSEEEHKQEHLEFIRSVSKLFKKLIAFKKLTFFTEQEMMRAHGEVVNDTYDFVSAWYGQHTSFSDRRFNEFIKFERRNS